MLYCSMQFFQAHEQIVFKEKKKKEQQKDFMVILMALCMTEEKI